jgi:prepilin-type N-terminal cleavage/methylation domain-containing protein
MQKKLLNQAGVTLIEVVISIVVVSAFSMVLVANFPRMKNSLSLSRSIHKLSQDIRRVQDLALSGHELVGENGQKISISGYGLYFDYSNDANKKKYIIYADNCPQAPYDKKYTTDVSQCPAGPDKIIETIEFEPGIVIYGIAGIGAGANTSVNFSPPNPTTTFSNLLPDNHSLNNLYPTGGIRIYLAVASNTSQQASISIYPSGLVEIK